MRVTSSNFNPEELLDVAEELIKDPNEPKIRTVMNRCYYSCYLSIRESKGLVEPKKRLKHTDAHIIASKKGKTANSLYMALQRYRIAADYSLIQDPEVQFTGVLLSSPKVHINLKNAKKAIKKARKFLEEYKS